MQTIRLLLATLGCAFATSAAANVVDPRGDFLPTYTGAPAPDLDILAATVVFDGVRFHLGTVTDGAIGSSVGSLFVWGINRGAGTPRLAAGTPPVGDTVLWDAVAVLFPDGTSRVATFPAAGAPTITPLFGAVRVAGNAIEGSIPVALLPSTGFDPTAYTFTLWSRLRVNPAVDGTNAEIADFAPNGAGIRAIPEPATWSLWIGGLVVVRWAAGRPRRRPSDRIERTPA